MRGNMLIWAALCLLLCWMLPVGSKKISFIVKLPEANPGIPLSMEEDAVDDIYLGCHSNMKKMVEDTYFNKEKTGKFEKAWKAAKACAQSRLQNKDKGDEALTKDHMQAICVYTSGYQGFYEMFNKAVRTNRKDYGTSFPFHSLQFWLTSAIQILSNKKNCHTTYRRTKTVFTGKVNQIIRFGSFASTSYIPTLTHFGEKTCFKIKTCSGAFLKKYPLLKDEEQEVLIPPYEKFSIKKKIKNQSVEGLEDCEVVYILDSAGVQSNVNCQAAYSIKNPRFLFNWWNKVKTKVRV